MSKHKKSSASTQRPGYYHRNKYVIQFAYDQAKGEEDNDYCKKCKYESKWCKHR